VSDAVLIILSLFAYKETLIKRFSIEWACLTSIKHRL